MYFKFYGLDFYFFNFVFLDVNGKMEVFRFETYYWTKLWKHFDKMFFLRELTSHYDNFFLAIS